MARVLREREYLHLLRLAAGMLSATNGDIVAAMRLALQQHVDLIGALHAELYSDLGPGNAILYVPEEGGLAIRLERHPNVPETEEVDYPEVDLFDFEVYEPPSLHRMVAPTESPLVDEGWE